MSLEEIKFTYSSKVLLSSTIDGVIDKKNVAEIWRKYYSKILNCVKSEIFSLSDIGFNNGVTIQPEKYNLPLREYLQIKLVV